MAETRTVFPPDNLTPDEANAVVGRYTPGAVAEPDPKGRGEGRPLAPGTYSTPPSGRDPAPPHGTTYVLNAEAARAASIREALAAHQAVGAEVPEHLQSLFDALPADLQTEPEPEPVNEDEAVEALEEAEAEAAEDAADERTDAERSADEEAAAARAELAEAGLEAEPEVPGPEPEPEAVEPEPEAEDELSEFTVPELQAELNALGVEWPPRARKAELVALLKGHQAAEG